MGGSVGVGGCGGGKCGVGVVTGAVGGTCHELEAGEKLSAWCGEV